MNNTNVLFVGDGRHPIFVNARCFGGDVVLMTVIVFINECHQKTANCVFYCNDIDCKSSFPFVDDEC